jgi:hypothetical protein
MPFRKATRKANSITPRIPSHLQIITFRHTKKHSENGVPLSPATHILFSLRASPTPSPSPSTQSHPIPPSNHTGFVSRAEPTTFPVAPRLPTPAPSRSLVNGGIHRTHISRQHANKSPAPTTKPATADGTSWEPRVMHVDGWNVGFEKTTQMFVKRKGRGSFHFESNMVSVSLNQDEEKGVLGDDSLLWMAESREGRPRLSDGFAYKHWVEETEGVNEPAIISEGSVGGVLEGEGVCGEKMQVGSPGGKGLDERRDSLRSSVYLTSYT